MNRFALIVKVASHDAKKATIIEGPSNDIEGLREAEVSLKFGKRAKEIKEGEIVAYAELNIIRPFHKPVIVRDEKGDPVNKPEVPAVRLIINNPAPAPKQPEAPALNVKA